MFPKGWVRVKIPDCMFSGCMWDHRGVAIRRAWEGRRFVVAPRYRTVTRDLDPTRPVNDTSGYVHIR
jgi:hypothetical protein